MLCWRSFATMSTLSEDISLPAGREMCLHERTTCRRHSLPNVFSLWFLCVSVGVTLVSCEGISPEQQVKYPGHNATFACDTECPHLRWELIPETNSSKTIVFNGTHSILTVNSNTDTVVQCIAYCVDITLTWNASLLIQDQLAAPSNMETNSNSSSITVSWTAPSSLDVTDVDPDIWYSVLIYNVTVEDRPTSILCTDCNNITETYYIFTPQELSPCHKFIFTVIPQNGVGDGQSSENVTGSFIESIQKSTNNQWQVIVKQRYIYTVCASTPTTGIMVIVEMTEHTALYILLNVTSCNSIVNDYISSVKRVLLYPVDLTGLPSEKYPNYVWNSTDPSQVECSTEDPYTNEEDISIYNFSGRATLSFEGSRLMATCTYECTVICLGNDNNVTHFTYDGDQNPHSIVLLPGNYTCTVLSEGVHHETLHCITIEDPVSTDVTEDRVTKIWIVLAVASVMALVVIVVALVVIALVVLCCIKKLSTKPQTNGNVSAMPSEEDERGKPCMETEVENASNLPVSDKSAKNEGTEQATTATTVNPHGKNDYEASRKVIHSEKGEGPSTYVEQTTCSQPGIHGRSQRMNSTSRYFGRVGEDHETKI